MVTTGGTSLKDDIMRLYQPVHLLVGTPGRILDLAKKGVCILKDCSMLVMDEVNALYFSFVGNDGLFSTLYSVYEKIISILGCSDGDYFLVCISMYFFLYHFR
jgi:hypothetical protein